MMLLFLYENVKYEEKLASLHKNANLWNISNQFIHFYKKKGTN